MSTAPVTVEIKRLPGGEDLPLPAYQSAHAAGMDLCAAIDADIAIAPGDIAKLPTGFSIALPEGYEAQIRPRSGLATRYGLTVPNAPGTIDADYRGPIIVALINLGREPITIERGMRIAQMIVAPVSRVQWSEVETLSDTERGAGGFGSTGS